MSDPARPIESLSREELRQLIAEYERSVAQEAAATQPAAPDDALLWMALVPNLPAAVAEASAFPRQPYPSAVERLESMVAEGQIVARQPRSRRTVGTAVTVYSMSDTRSVAVLAAYRAAPDPTAVSEREARLRKLLAQIGQSIADVGEELLGRTTPLWRWAALARHADNADAMAAAFESFVDTAGRAEDAGELKHWIETARPLADLMADYIEVGMNDALVRAGRRLELLHRRDYDRHQLQSFMRRDEQIAAFNQLRDGDKQSWALHYVGVGGVGKTMLLRYIANELASNYMTARIDFDYLSPDYPQRNPGLLLWAFAQDLRMQVISAASEQAIDLFARADQQLEQLRQEREDLRRSARPERATDEPRFREALGLYIEALRSLGRPVLLILDTCEELAKVSPAGTVPENVEETFRILRALHDGPQTLDDPNAPSSPTEGLADLRVIFSGRRLLARKGAGWRQEPPSGLAERPYLRLHEIRGFSEAEAEQYLRTVVKGPQGLVFRPIGQPVDEHDRAEITTVPEPFIASIIRLSSPDAGATAGLVWDEQRADRRDQLRCNPYELSFYADWATERPPPALEELSVANIGHYIKMRILGRLEDQTLAAALPAIALLGHVDAQTLRAIAGHEKDASAQVAQELFERLRSQEWMSLRPAITPPGAAAFAILSVQPGMRKRLLAFFRQHHSQLSAAHARAADYLERETLSRDLGKLDWSTFDAALRLLERDPDPDRVIRWWHQAEARILSRRDFEWALKLIGPILGEDGAAGIDPDRPGPEDPSHSRMRTAVLSTYAAALLHQGDGMELAEVWQEVQRESVAHAATRAQPGLQLRAQAGLISAQGMGRATIPQGEIGNFWSLIDALSPAQLTLDQIAALVAAVETLTEQAELERRDAGAVGETTLGPLSLGPVRLVYLIEQARSATLSRASAWPDQADGMLAFARLLAARAHRLRDEYDSARGLFQQALAATPEALAAAQNTIWNDWIPPADLAARLRLEYIRALVPARLAPGQALAEIGGWTAAPTTVDSERLHAAILRLQLAQGPPAIGTLAPLGWADPQTAQLVLREQQLVAGPSRCNAHREIAPLFIAAAEVAYSTGQAERVHQQMALISSQSSRFQLEQELLHAERAMSVLVRRMRLRDESEQPGTSFETSLDLADRSLIWALDGLDGSKISQPIPAVPESIAPPLRPRWLHAIWRTRFTLAPSAAQAALRWARQNLAPALVDLAPGQLLGIDQAALRLDLLEARLIALQAGESSALPQVSGLDFAPVDWWREQIARPAEALAVLLRRSCLVHFETSGQGSSAAPLSLSAVLPAIVAQVGVRRAAEIALDEGELLALRLPLAAAPLLDQACDWFAACGDHVGAVLAGTALALLKLRVGDGSPYSTMQWVGEHYQRLRDAIGPTPVKAQELPAWEKLAQIAAAATQADLDALGPRSWRPWLVRMVIGLIGPDLDSVPAATVRRWLADTYSTLRRSDVDNSLIDLARALSADLEGWLQSQEAPVLVAMPVAHTQATSEAEAAQVSHAQLRRNIEQYFNLDELHSLCFDLGIDYESLAGDTKTEQAIGLIRMMEQQGRLPELVDELRRLRSHVDWLATPAALPRLPKNLRALPVATIRQVLMASFNEAELTALCFDLGVDYEALEGRTKADRVGSLCDLLAQQRQIDHLVAYVCRERPEIEWAPASAPIPPEPISNDTVLKLSQILATYFNESELRDVVFDLAIDFDNLAGRGKADRARNLVHYAVRHSLLEKLIELVQRERPFVALSTQSLNVAGDPLKSASATLALRQVLIEYFNQEELKDLAFDLGIDYESLGGEGKSSRVRELISYVERVGGLDLLVGHVRRLRPHALDDQVPSPQRAGTSYSVQAAPPPAGAGLMLSISNLHQASSADLPLTQARPVTLSLTDLNSRAILCEVQATTPGPEPYETALQSLPPALRHAIAGAYQARTEPALTVQIQAPEDLHGPCWEAALWLAAGANAEPGSLHMRRLVTNSKEGRQRQFSAQPKIRSWAGDRVGDALIRQAWSQIQPVAQPIPTYQANLSADPDARILHLIGAAEDTTTGLRFRPGANTSARPEAVPATAGEVQLRAGDIGHLFPNLSACIIQGPLLRSGARRLNGNRRDAALARAFAAQVAAQGMPVVIVIPSLPSALATAVASLIVKDIYTLSADSSLEALHQAVDRGRQTILHTQLEAPQETWLDISLYALWLFP